MTNKEASNVLRLFANLIEINGLPEERILTFRKAYEQAISELESDTIPQGEWIPVSERLPFNYVLCLFCDKEGNIFYGHRKSNNLWYEEYQNENISDVIAWQPLPEPFQKGEQQ